MSVDIDAIINDATREKGRQYLCKLCLAIETHPDIAELVSKGRERKLSFEALARLINQHWGISMSDSTVRNHLVNPHGNR